MGIVRGGGQITEFTAVMYLIKELLPILFNNLETIGDVRSLVRRGGLNHTFCPNFLDRMLLL